MSSELMLRRREMMSKADNPYEGFTYGRIYNGNIQRSNTPIYGKKQWLSPAYDVSALSGHSVVYNYNAQAKLPKDFWGIDYAENSCKCVLQNGSNMAASNTNGYNGARNSAVKNTVLLPTNAKTFVAATTFDLDDFFLYDRTAGVYIYRGKNVTADSQ